MKKLVTAVVLVSLIAVSAQAAFEWLVPILQPVESDGGTVACATTYSAYYSKENEASVLMKLTLAPNAIVQSSGIPANRNEAAKLGLNFHINQVSDTLIVNVQAPPDVSPNAVAMTLWCGLRNVRGAMPAVKCVRYVLSDNESLAKYSGFYDLRTVEPILSYQVLEIDTFGPQR